MVPPSKILILFNFILLAKIGSFAAIFAHSDSPAANFPTFSCWGPPWGWGWPPELHQDVWRVREKVSID